MSNGLVELVQQMALVREAIKGADSLEDAAVVVQRDHSCDELPHRLLGRARPPRELDDTSAGDLDCLAACYSEDAIQVHAMFGQTTGRAAIVAVERPMFDAFSDIKWTATRAIAAATGDWHAVEWCVTARNTGPLPGPTGTVPATNRTVDLTGTSILHLDEHGLIREEHRYFNPGDMFVQLGLTH